MLRYVIDTMAVIFFKKVSTYRRNYMISGDLLPKSSLLDVGTWWEMREIQMKQTGAGSDDHWVKGDSGLLLYSLQYIEMFYNKF